MKFLIVSTVIALSSTASALEMKNSSDIKGYGKRDRVQFESDQTIMPSQLHEVIGFRTEAGASYRSTVIRSNGDDKALTAPTGLVRAYYGGEHFVLGAGFSHAESTSDAEGKQFEEFQKTQKAVGQLAYTFGRNVTIGGESVSNWVDFSQNENNIKDREYNAFFRRETFSVSYHDPRKEFGLAYTTAYSRNMDNDSLVATPIGFGLALPAERANRRIYAPAHYTAFARGNFSDNWSGLASISHVQYDENLEEASAAFSEYRRDDRLAGKLQGIYWLDSRRSSVSLTGVYEGGTYVDANLDTDAYGYKLANRYGGSLTAIGSVGGRKYVGVMVGHMRGERNGDNDASTNSVEQENKIATSFSLAF